MGERFVWRDGRIVNRETGAPMSVPDGPLSAPMIMPNMPEYASPINGKVITSRRERREDMKRNNCVEAGDPGCSPTGGKLKNKAFCAKRGLKVSEEFL
ncbi:MULTISPECIES: hypothetical protein [unclassified Mesorhizobium]|uniref:hypothetical protein n=1 Tax=unclassified Mesorhizobium TaxID=325217 RepID=UPI001129CF38|nr:MULTISPECIES: hypothetical protein [unclassified Mesorhizobium]TPJ38182.1 hypothetical protein FJ437_30870 [Mesorhizobium sp. B2-6-6]MCA0000953.1 hypothetical protein [Mesorhizobium sp. B264B2A]MCA0004702.1 hypothetical protein [Mesorhizobium sp. B264B1B]MCA0019099.1 hypothetical protein [Mesorhizobium sp. B264B1A]TPJ52724.1 hypothetical protein FJ426_15850 [Mesorhizobium sp. B2-6-4]